MKYLALFAAVALATLTQQAVACDKEAKATPVIVAECGGGNCATQQRSDEPVTRQEPQECNGGNCATPTTAPKVAVEPAATIVADGCAGSSC